MKQLSILLVEDNDSDAFIVRESLEEAGIPHLVHLVKTGTLAMEYLCAHSSEGDQRPDLVILDLNLPGLSGRQILSEMQADPALERIPVAIFTTSQSEKDIGREFPGLRTTFAAKTANFAEVEGTMRRFMAFAEAP